MLRKWLDRKSETTALQAVEDAQDFLSTWRRKLSLEGSDNVVGYGDGVGRVAAMLRARCSPNASFAQIFDLTCVEAEGELVAIRKDLQAALIESGPKIRSASGVAQQTLAKLAFGSGVFMHVATMRWIASTGPESVRKRATDAHYKLGTMARALAHAAAEVNTPEQAMAEPW